MTEPVEVVAERVDKAEREFVSRLSDALVIAYRRMGGIARLARAQNGAATIRNIATLEAAAVFRGICLEARAQQEHRHG